MDNAGTYYTNLVGLGSWKLETSKHLQIIALTAQISELKMEIQSLTSTHASNKSSKGPRNYGNFEAWCLVKINNNAEFNMVKKGNKKFYWCDKHQYPGSDVKGMNVFHKSTEHDAWKARKDELNK
jgi:hypothetical protein